jgi:hypothetical protein
MARWRFVASFRHIAALHPIGLATTAPASKFSDFNPLILPNNKAPDQPTAQTASATPSFDPRISALPHGTPHANLCGCRSVTRDPGSPATTGGPVAPGDGADEEDRSCHQAVQIG